MNRTCKVAALFIAYLCFVGFVAAADTYWTPNIIEVNPDVYSLSVFSCNNTKPIVNATIMFTGALLLNGQGAGAGKTVRLSRNSTNDLSSWIECASGLTNASSYYNIPVVFEWNVTQHFKGGYTP